MIEADRCCPLDGRMVLLKWRGRVSKPAFRDRLCDALRESLPQAVIEVTGDLELSVSGLAEGKAIRIWLGRAYEEMLEAPAESDEVVERWLQSILVSVTDFPVDPEQVIPTIKAHDWLGSQPQPASSAPWAEAYNAQLTIVYAEYRDSVRYVGMDELGLTQQALRERALANLRRLIPEIMVAGQEGCYLVSAGGTLDASLMLMDEVLDNPALRLRGKPLMGVPDRDSFWIADDASPWAVLQAAVSVAQCHRKAAYPISPLLYVRHEGRWEPLDPAPHDEMHAIADSGVIDVLAVRKGGGCDLSIVIPRPLEADARSLFRLCRKLDGYLQTINSPSFVEEHGAPSSATTFITVRVHPRSDREALEVLEAAAGWVQAYHATLRIEKITPVAVT
jgi:hypothetical protein